MSEHAWVRDNLASYLAGGLDAEERELLEEHAAGCADCAHALEDLRFVDHGLESLFAAVRPSAALEDRSIQVLRQTPHRPKGVRLSRSTKVILAVAAGLLLTALGAGLSHPDELGGLWTPSRAENRLKQLEGLAWHSAGDTGLRDPERLAGEMSQRYSSLIHSNLNHGQNFDESPTKQQADAKERYASKSSEAGGRGPRTEGEGHLPLVQAPEVHTGSLQFSADGRKAASGKTDANGVNTWGFVDRDESGRRATNYFKPADLFAQLKSSEEQVAGKQLKDQEGQGKSNNAPANRPPPEKAREEDGERGQKIGGEKEPAKPATPEPVGRKIIRSGEMAFEVDSFDAAVTVITRLVAAAKGGFIATVNSEKLPNGKVCGSVVLRMPPEKLDAFVQDLRTELGKSGELKNQRIGSQDITKQYTDLESRLRAARTMEDRLLKIIKEGKGQIKDLLQAEKELGVWRTRIEEIEGELRYYTNLIALSTLTITLTEKEIRVAATVTENERVQAGVEVEDVEKAFRAALDAVAEAKGRVTKSELKQQAAGQYSALLHFEVVPEAAGTLRDRLRQLGSLVRLEIDRTQQGEGGVLALHDGKVKRGATQFFVSLYNLVNVAPRETVTLRLAAADVRAAYHKLREAVERAQGRVNNGQLNEQDRQNISAQLDFDVRRAEEGAMQAALAEAGEALSRQVTRLPASENVTDAKVLFKVELVNAENIPARETTTLAVEVTDVKGALAVLNAQVREAHGRTVDGPQVGFDRSGKATARVVYVVPLAAAPGLIARIEEAGRVRLEQGTKNTQAPDGKLALARLDVMLSNAEVLVPGEAGLWTQVRRGLSFSLRGLSMSAMWLVVGLLFVLPWILLIYVVVWLVRRLWDRTAPLTPAPVAAGGGPAPGG